MRDEGLSLLCAIGLVSQDPYRVGCPQHLAINKVGRDSFLDSPLGFLLLLLLFWFFSLLCNCLSEAKLPASVDKITGRRFKHSR